MPNQWWWMDISSTRLSRSYLAWTNETHQYHYAVFKTTGQEIPLSFINQLPCNIGEVIALGSWSLTKNIYRFEDQVIQMLLKTRIQPQYPSFLLNLLILRSTFKPTMPISTCKMNKWSVLFLRKTRLNDRKVLFTTVYTDTGLAKTITMHFPDDDDFESTVEDCMTDFIDTFFWWKELAWWTRN